MRTRTWFASDLKPQFAAMIGGEADDTEIVFPGPDRWGHRLADFGGSTVVDFGGLRHHLRRLKNRGASGSIA